MISFRQYIQEVFSGGDRGFSYTKDDNKHDEYPDPNRTKYNVSLPDHVAPAIVSFKHSKKWAVDAEWDKKEE